MEPATENPQAAGEPGETEDAPERAPASPAPDEPSPASGSESLTDGREHSLDPRSVTVSRLGGAIGAVVIFGATTVALVVVLFSLSSVLSGGQRLLIGAGWLLLNGLVSTHAWFWPALSYRYTAWKLDQEGMHIRQGVLWRSETSIPRSRIQHTDVSRGPLQRGFGLATLVIHTAGTHNASIPLSGLSYEDALIVRDHLIEGGEDDGV